MADASSFVSPSALRRARPANCETVRRCSSSSCASRTLEVRSARSASRTAWSADASNESALRHHTYDPSRARSVVLGGVPAATTSACSVHPDVTVVITRAFALTSMAPSAR